MSRPSSINPISPPRSWRCNLQVLAWAVLAAIPALALAQTVPATIPATDVISVPSTAPGGDAARLDAAISAPATSPSTITMPIAPPSVNTAGAGGGGSTTAPAADVASVKEPFVATITADKVYVRSGPGTAYYELGHLNKGDLVYIVGSIKTSGGGGWYQILPPNGTYCLIAKEMVELDPGGATGTVAKDYVNVRAGTAMNKARDPSAVLTVVRKGTKLKVIGTNEKYYEIAPPERAYVYVSPQFIKASPESSYKVPDLKLAPGMTGPSVTTVEAPTAPPSLASAGGTGSGAAGRGSRPTILIPSGSGAGSGSTVTPPSSPGTVTNPPTTPETVVAVTPATEPAVPIAPKVVYSSTATTRFNDVNARYQQESKKPPAQQNPEQFLKDFQEILAMENIAPSVKAGATANIAAIERTLTVQRLIKEQAAAQEVLKKQSDALQEQYESAEKAIAAARQVGPYSAEGVLQTSTIVKGKYVLVNPKTGRAVAYIDPSSASVDIGRLVGKYIGVRGMTRKMDNSEITLIEVSNATMLPENPGDSGEKGGGDIRGNGKDGAAPSTGAK